MFDFTVARFARLPATSWRRHRPQTGPGRAGRRRQLGRGRWIRRQ